MKILNIIEIKSREIWNFLLFPFVKIYNPFRFKTKRKNFNKFLDNINWEYRIPRFKLVKNIRKEDIFSIRPLCKKCGCELRNDFSYNIKRTTWKVYKFTCPDCNIVHDINAESLNDYFLDLRRRLAFDLNNRNKKKN